MANNVSIYNDEQEHPDQEQLMLFVDGELSPKETKRCENHLDACWSCRVRVSRIEETIAYIIKFEETVTRYQKDKRSHDNGHFDSRLHALAGEMSRRSSFSPFFEFRKQRISFHRLQLWNPLAFSTLAALLIVAILYQFVIVPPVSAAELLQKSITAQDNALYETPEPVLHQRIQVRRIVGDTESAASVEIWNDTVNGRVRTGSGSDRVLFDPVISDLTSVLAANHMNEHRPLSAASYKAWSDSLASKSEQVTKENDALTIKTTTDAQPGQIVEARLTLHSADYHPTALYINVNAAIGPAAFELTEQDYQIISLKDIDPSVFADSTKVDVATTNTSAPSVSASPESSASELAVSNTNTNLSAANTAAPASTSAEVEVLDLLHSVGADISEQINVTRTADGRLLVEGLVESDQRKKQILAALAPVAGDPAIKIKLQTIEEATLALKKQKAQATPSSVEQVEVEKGAYPTDAELRAYFGNRGGDTDAAIRGYASRVIGRAESAAFQASALNRMVNRFTPQQLAELNPADRAKWLGILRGYAAAVRRETAALRGELQPVFGGFEAGEGGSVTSNADLIASARRLYELASSNERTIRAAFSLSTGGSTSAIKTAQFRRSVAEAEALAAAIERAR